MEKFCDSRDESHVGALRLNDQQPIEGLAASGGKFVTCSARAANIDSAVGLEPDC
jgi:hypothetical protein